MADKQYIIYTLMIDSNNILRYLQNHKSRLMKEYHLSKIGLFGSFARDEANTTSDIDLVIEFEPDTPNIYDLKVKLKDEIQAHFNRQVDLCRLKYIKPIFKEHILSDIKYV